MRAAGLLVVALVLAGCGGSDSDEPQRSATGAALFAYDESAPLDAAEAELPGEGRVTASELTYSSPGSGTVDAYVLRPRDAAPRKPPLIFLHGGGGNREQLLPIALAWAQEGGTALLLDAARAARAATPGARLRAEHRATIDTVIRVRRAVDYLEDDRVGFVGWSGGARIGAIVAGVEPRIDAFALMSGAGVPVAAYVAQAPPALRDDVRRLLGEIDPLRWVKRARPNTIFFQNGRRDEVVPREALEQLTAAAPKPQRVVWYDAPHSLNERAYADHRAWFSRVLGRG